MSRFYSLLKIKPIIDAMIEFWQRNLDIWLWGFFYPISMWIWSTYVLKPWESLVREYCRNFGFSIAPLLVVFYRYSDTGFWAFIDMWNRCSAVFSNNIVLYLHETWSLHSVSQGRFLQFCIPKHTRDKDGSKKLLCEPFLVVNGLCTAVGILLLPEWGIHSFAEGCHFIPLCKSKIVIEPWRI